MDEAQANSIHIGVAPTKFTHGINNLDDPAQALVKIPMQQALLTAWESDAHFFNYHTVNTGRPTWPRLNKPVLGKMRYAGADIKTRLFVFDWDILDHLPWAQYMDVDEWVRWFNEQFCAAWPWAASYYVMYTTKHGARIIYASDAEIPVDDAEKKHRWLVGEFRRFGLLVDPNCSDWTRCFRLPYVRRDGLPTNADPSFRLYPNWDRFVQGVSIPELDRHEQSEYTAPIRNFDEPKPPHEHAASLLKEYNPTSGRTVQAKWLKKAKIKLKGRDCEGILFNQAVLAEPGHRNSMLHKYIGQAISLLFGADGIGPEHIYSLFLEAVEGLEPDADTPDWTDTLWDHIGRIWVREEAKQTDEERAAAEQLEDQQDLMETLIGGMQQWCQHPALFGSKPEAQAFVARHLIVGVGNTYHVMRMDGYYDSLGVSATNLIARIRILGMDAVIDTWRQTGENMPATEAAPSTIINQRTCIANSIVGKPCIRGGIIHRVDTGQADLILPSYNRNEDLEPEFSVEVDAWLQILFGPYYTEACEWIAWSLAFDEGSICAMSVVGDPGVGKKLLTVGLSECLDVPDKATAHDIVSQYQYGLLNSPFLIVNEGWPKGQWGMHPADSFRALVDGEPIAVNRKFLAPIKVYNPCRIIFTANNTSVVSMLGGDRDLSPEDRLALQVRLKHFEVGDMAAHWLRQRGGFNFTGRAGKRWIEGDSGEPSNFLVAKHFLYLYSIRGPRTFGRRFLVDGNCNDELMYEFRTMAGSNPLVIESVLRMMDSLAPQWRLPVLQGRLYATTSMVLDFFRTNLAQTANQRLTIKQVANAFKSICLHEPVNPVIINNTKARWWELDPELLCNVARRDGRRSQVLDELVEQRRIEGLAQPVPQVTA